MAGAGSVSAAPVLLALLLALCVSPHHTASARKISIPLSSPLALRARHPGRVARPKADPPADPCATLKDLLWNNLQAFNESFESDYIPYVFARPSEVLPCTRSVAFNESRDLGTLASVINDFKSFYSLLHVARRTPTLQLPSYYDIVGALSGLYEGDWSTAEDFYSAIKKEIRHLNDGHTRLEVACPPFNHWLALSFVGVVEDGVPTVRMAPQNFLNDLFSNISQSPFGFDPYAFAGVKVALIEGQPAWEYMLRFANEETGVLHTEGQRLNFAFASLTPAGTMWGAFGSRSDNPGKDYVTATVVRAGGASENVSIPFISYAPQYLLDGFNSTSTYYSSFCQPYSYTPPTASTSSAAALAGAKAVAHLRQLAHELVKPSVGPLLAGIPLSGVAPSSGINQGSGSASGAGAVQSGQQQSKAARDLDLGFQALLGAFPGTPEPYQQHREWDLSAADSLLQGGTLISQQYDLWQVYKLKDGITSVVVINTFEPNLPYRGGAIEYFILNTLKAFNLASQNSSRVIIDLSNNGGGIVQLADYMTELIVGSAAVGPASQVQDPSNMLADTDVVRAMRNASLGRYNWDLGYSDLNGVPFTKATQDQFFYPITEQAFGDKGFPGNYSSLFKLYENKLSDQYYPFPPAFGDKPFFLFSNGFCYSTCSSFAINMNTKFGVPLVDIGGNPKNPTPMAFSAGAGGFVTFSVNEDFIYSASPEILALPDSPQPYGIIAQLPMKVANGFLQEKGGYINMSTPLDFWYAPGAIQINFTPDNVDDFTLQWLQAAQAYWSPTPR